MKERNGFHGAPPMHYNSLNAYYMGQDHEDVNNIEYRNQKEITFIYIKSCFVL